MNSRGALLPHRGGTLPGVIVFMENVSVPGGPTAFNDPQWFFAGEFIRHVVASDIDFDGDQDLLALDYTGDQILLFRNGSNPGMLRSGNGSDGSVLPPVTAEAPGPFRGLDGSSMVEGLARMTPSEIMAIAEERDRRAGGGAD